MSLCQLFIQPEAAYQSVAGLGEIGIAQFRDVSRISFVSSPLIPTHQFRVEKCAEKSSQFQSHDDRNRAVVMPSFQDNRLE